MKKFLTISIPITILLLAIIWGTTFILVVQPIGAIPKGRTVWIFKPDRLFTQKVIPFVCSADGILLDTVGSINLLGRGVVLATLIKSGDIILRLPYSRTLYLMTTDGKEFDR